MPEVDKHYKDVKRLIHRQKPTGPFGGHYRFSPYMACGHACRYCDGRHEKYFVEGDFERDIVIRRNAPALLEQELPKLREQGPICISSGVSDAYQPVEAEEQLTRRCGEILAQHALPVIVQTKSRLVLRDAEIWDLVRRRSAFSLYVSLTWADDALRRIFEPHAAPVEARLETLSAFRQRGAHVGVLAMPFVPFVGDAEAQLRAWAKGVAAAGAAFALPGLMTLKRGRQWTAFMETIEREMPARRADFERLYESAGEYGEPAAGYARAFQGRVTRALRDVGLSPLIPHSLYRNQFALYDEIGILLGHLSQLYRERGADTTRLDRSRRRYDRWLAQRRRTYYRRRSLSFRELEHELAHLARTDKLTELLGNRRLAGFVAEVVLDRRVFNYHELKLEDAA